MYVCMFISSMLNGYLCNKNVRYASVICWICDECMIDELTCVEWLYAYVMKGNACMMNVWRKHMDDECVIPLTRNQCWIKVKGITEQTTT